MISLTAIVAVVIICFTPVVADKHVHLAIVRMTPPPPPRPADNLTPFSFSNALPNINETPQISKKLGGTIYCRYKVQKSGFHKHFSNFSKFFRHVNYLVTWTPPTAESKKIFGSCVWEYQACNLLSKKAVVLKRADGPELLNSPEGGDTNRHFVVKTEVKHDEKLIDFIFTDVTVNTDPVYMKAFKKGLGTGIPSKGLQRGRIIAPIVQLRSFDKLFDVRMKCRQYIHQIPNGVENLDVSFSPIIDLSSAIPTSEYYRHIVTISDNSLVRSSVPSHFSIMIGSFEGEGSTLEASIGADLHCFLGEGWAEYFKPNKPAQFDWIRELKTSQASLTPQTVGGGGERTPDVNTVGGSRGGSVGKTTSDKKSKSKRSAKREAKVESSAKIGTFGQVYLKGEDDSLEVLSHLNGHVGWIESVSLPKNVEGDKKSFKKKGWVKHVEAVREMKMQQAIAIRRQQEETIKQLKEQARMKEEANGLQAAEGADVVPIDESMMILRN